MNNNFLAEQSEDHESLNAKQSNKREWVKPEFEIIPVRNQTIDGGVDADWSGGIT